MTLTIDHEETSTSLVEAPKFQGSDSYNSFSPSTPEPEDQVPVTPIVLGVLGALGIGAAVIEAAGWVEVNPTIVIGAGVVAVIAGIVARRFVGGGRGLIPLGIVMAIALAGSFVVSPHLRDGTGDSVNVPQTFEQVQSEYIFGIGSLDIDLRNVDFPPGVHNIDIEMGLGNVRVWLPADINYSVVGDLDVGKVDVFDQSSDGFGNTITSQGSVDSDATIVLNLDVDMGHAEVNLG
jgi:hypothetical protein